MHFPGVSWSISIHWAFTATAGTPITHRNLLPAHQKPPPSRETMLPVRYTNDSSPFPLIKGQKRGSLKDRVKEASSFFFPTPFLRNSSAPGALFFLLGNLSSSIEAWNSALQKLPVTPEPSTSELGLSRLPVRSSVPKLWGLPVTGTKEVKSSPVRSARALKVLDSCICLTPPAPSRDSACPIEATSNTGRE